MGTRHQFSRFVASQTLKVKVDGHLKPRFHFNRGSEKKFGLKQLKRFFSRLPQKNSFQLKRAFPGLIRNTFFQKDESSYF